MVLEHSNFYFISNITALPLPDGVDLFFVLSGYLIGTILIKKTEETKNFNLRSAFNFLIRRWFRTLPNYFLFLFVNVILINFGIIKGFVNDYLVTYFVFFQNFYKPYDFLFWESWSLSVEEWFYFLFPLMIVLIYRATKDKFTNKNILLLSILVFITLPLIYRLAQFQINSNLDFDLYFKKLVATRMDTIGFGLLGAFIHFYKKKYWLKLKNVLFVIGMMLLLALTRFGNENIVFLKTLYYSFIGLSILFLLPLIEGLKKEIIPLKPFQFISKISFSMYLINIPLISVFKRVFIISNKMEAQLLYIIFWITLILISYIVYRFYELPLMKLRDSKLFNHTNNISN